MATATATRSRSTAARSAPAPKAKSAKDPGFIEVRVGRLPGRIESIALNGGRTVKDALEGAGLSADGKEIRVQGKAATLATELKAGHTVLLVGKIKGN